MSWFNVWDGLKTKTCRYLLQRYLGQFFDNNLNLEQLKVDLYNGKAVVKNVSLKVDALNELFEGQGWAVEVISGHIGCLTVVVPWNALITHDSSIEVEDFVITLRPIKRRNGGTSMLESMWSSVSSSMQMAEECMKQSDGDGQFEIHSNSLVGLEKFAETIDNVLNRIQVKFINSLLKVEHSLSETQKIEVTIKLDVLQYKNETGCDRKASDVHEQEFNCANNFKDNKYNFEEKTNLFPMIAKHNISLHGFKIYTTDYSIAYKESNRALVTTPNLYQQVQIIEVKGIQKIEIKIKQTEDVDGPKVSLDVELGSIYTLLTPRQIHLLFKMAYAFYEDDSMKLARMNKTSRKCGKNDKYIFSTESTTPRSNMTGILNNNGTWCADNDNIDDAFTSSENILDNTSNINSIVFKKAQMENCCDSLSSSFSTNTTTTTYSKQQHRVTRKDISGEILHFEIRMVSLSAIVLHEDVEPKMTMTIVTKLSLDEHSSSPLLRIAEMFFSTLPENHIDGSFVPTLEVREKNHLNLKLTPVFVEGNQNRERHILLSKVLMTATKLDFYESLGNKMDHLILFNRKDNCAEGYHKLPEFSMVYKSTYSGLPKDITANAVDINLEKCTVQFDITIYDRLSALLGPSPYSNICKEQSMFTCEKSTANRETELSVVSPALVLKLRFPIVDARPNNDPAKTPWWKQNIRSDFLNLEFHQFNLKWNARAVSIISYEINVFYCDGNINNMIHIATTQMMASENENAKKAALKYSKISIMLEGNMPQKRDSSDDTATIPGLPFSSKHVRRQSDTAHCTSDSAHSEEVLLPGETEEINQFCENALQSSKLTVQIEIPTIEICFESKQLYEIIYNRLNSDLFMWEPTSPLFLKKSYNRSLQKNIISENTKDLIHMTETQSVDFFEYNKMCHEGTPFDSLEDPEENIKNFKDNRTFNPIKDVHVSTDEKNLGKGPEDVQLRKTSSLSIDVLIDRASLSFYVPVRDTDNHVLPSQLGKFDFKIVGLRLFSVNEYNGDNNLGYICLQLKEIQIFHCGLLPTSFRIGTHNLKPIIDECMSSTFYNIQNDMRGNYDVVCKRKEVVSLIIEIKKVPNQKIKRLRITAGVKKAIFRYNPTSSQHAWINQLMDFLDVLDYPIEGYNPFALLTEMQIHLWDCGIDYRPINFPYRAMIDIGSFSISSNIISSVAGCNLRFVVEDCFLSITPFINCSQKYPNYKITFLDDANLIPVLELGLCDISIRFNEQSLRKCPKIDLRCSLYDVHMRTCSDSGRAVAQLISYIANDGDSSFSDDDRSNMSYSSDDFKGDAFVSNEKKENEVMIHQQKHVNVMMAEAVKEIVPTKNVHQSSEDTELLYGEHGFELFYFPDENVRLSPENMSSDSKKINEENDLFNIHNFESNVMLNSYYVKTNSELLLSLGNSQSPQKFCSNDKNPPQEKEYCIIPDKEKAFMNRCGIKNIKISEDPLRIVDNHFCLPTVKTDILQSPENFPMAELRYTLCEMTFTWHLYGGKDFPEPILMHTNKTESENTLMSETYRYGVSGSRQSKTSKSDKNLKKNMTRKINGGSGRIREILVQIQLSKVRFSHEVYPAINSHASRQVLLISEIEIRDRLQSSEINKFLYHPKSKNLSNKSSEHMVIIKALHVRPNPFESTAQECSLRISILPIKLNIDQDTLLFLEEFFSNLVDNQGTEKIYSATDLSKLDPATQLNAPIMSIEDVDALKDLKARNLVTQNLNILIDDKQNVDAYETKRLATENSQPIYFREIIFSPALPICLDYHGRRVELSRGPVAGLIMGLAQLQGSDICLRELVNRRGLLGWDKLLNYLFKEWLRDIKRNQLPKILSGIGPTNAVLELFQGIYDLFRLPIQQYQKDGRVIRGFQLGAQSFSARTALAALEITSRIIHILQFTAETTFDMLSPGPSVRRAKKPKKGNKRHSRPKDIREGVTNAYMIVKEGINDSANCLIETAMVEHDQKGYTGAVGAVMRQIPQLVVCPAVLATQATTNILGGAKSSLVPEMKIEAREKWKHDKN